MTRLCVLMFLLLLAVGCSAEDQRQWNEAMKDLRGDNQQMRSGPSRFQSSDDD